MSITLGKKGNPWGLCLWLVLWVGQEGMPCYAAVDDAAIPLAEFSGSLVKTVKGRQYHAQVFAKGAMRGYVGGLPAFSTLIFSK